MAKIAIILCFIAATLVLSEGSLTLECAKKYLKDRNVYEDALSFVDAYIGQKTECESSVKSALSTVTSDLRTQLGGNRQQRPYTECIMRDIEEEDESYDLLSLRLLAVDMVSGWRFWSYFSRKSLTENLQAERQKIVEKSWIKCQGHREFGDLFTNILEGSVSWDHSGEEEYCIRAHLVEKSYLNKNYYDFRPNPRNVQTRDLDCNKIVAGVVDKIYEEVKIEKSISDCKIKIYREKEYALNILKADVLSKLNLQKSDKSREKQDFIQAMFQISLEARKC